MSEPFRSRDFRPVAPQLRPHKKRSAVRVIVTDGEAVLLFADTDPGIPGSRWYTTPGGGIDAGETVEEAALREVFEETGLQLQVSDLVGPVMSRTVVHGYSDQICEQDEVFFVVGTSRFEPDTSGHTVSEQFTLVGHVWASLTEVHRLDAPVWPSNLCDIVALADQPDQWLWQLGVVEESTIPVSTSHKGSLHRQAWPWQTALPRPGYADQTEEPL